MLIYVPIVMHGLRLFLQELHCLPNCYYHLRCRFLPSFIALHLLLSEIVKCTT